LRQRLEVIERQRQTRRQARTDVPLASCALVGYTNAGKSTLLNKLTHSDVLADNLLFATLDPTSRRLELPSGRRVIVTDTVGFIQGLPTELVEAFAATLEEVREAHLLCIVVDASHPDAELQLETVLDTLAGMECDQQSLLVMSKCDRLTPSEARSMRMRLGDIAGVTPLAVSSIRGAGLRELRQMLDDLAAGQVADTPGNRRIAARAQPPPASHQAAAG
jgi:GTP-binding protein HflX